MRGCPSLVGGRPAKSVVERPRGFKSHTPRFLFLQIESLVLLRVFLCFFVVLCCCVLGERVGFAIKFFQFLVIGFLSLRWL